MVAITVAAVLAVLLVVNLLNHRWRSHWYLRTCITGSVIILAIGRVSGLTWSELGLGAGSFVPGLVWGAATIAGVFVFYLVVVSVRGAHRFFADDRLSGRSGAAVARHALVEVPLGTVLLEETAFRGVLLADITLAWGEGAAVVATSVVFGIWHVLPALSWHESNEGVRGSLGGRERRARVIVVVLTVLGTALAGVAFCLLRLWSDSLLAPMAFHWAVNGLGLFFVWWLRRRTSPPVG